ncbi:Os03g0625966, partial [Oryza sativa Japonica Group]
RRRRRVRRQQPRQLLHVPLRHLLVVLEQRLRRRHLRLRRRRFQRPLLAAEHVVGEGVGPREDVAGGEQRAVRGGERLGGVAAGRRRGRVGVLAQPPSPRLDGRAQLLRLRPARVAVGLVPLVVVRVPEHLAPRAVHLPLLRRVVVAVAAVPVDAGPVVRQPGGRAAQPAANNIHA